MEKRAFRNAIPYLGFIIVITLFTICTSGKLLQPDNIKLITEQSILTLISSIGVLFVMTLGSLDFSQGSILGIVSIIAASVSRYNIPLAILLTVGAGAVIGLANGLLNEIGRAHV